MRLGIPNIAVKRDSIDETARAIADYGLQSVMYYQALAGGLTDRETLRRIRQTFEGHGLVIDHVGGYMNPICTDENLRQAGIKHLKGLCQVVRELGTDRITCFAGTAVPVSALLWEPETHSERSYDLFIETMRDVLTVAEAEGVTIVLEPFVVTVMKDADTSLRIFRDLGSRNVGVVMDVVNFYNPDDIYQPRQNELMTECFTKLTPYIRAIHLKDLGPQDTERPTPGKPPVGDGMLDYGHFATLVRESGIEYPLIVEGLGQEENIPRVLSYVRRVFQPEPIRPFSKSEGNAGD